MAQLSPPAAPTAAGVAYDAAYLLGFGDAVVEALPEPKPGEIIVTYGGWSLQDLRDKVVGANGPMWNQNWYEKYQWATAGVPAGVYALRLPVPGSNGKDFCEQVALLLPGEEPAPVVLAATAMLVHFQKTRERLALGQWLRCKERAAPVCRVELNWHGGRLNVYVNWDDDPDPFVWLASARTSGRD